MYKHILGMSCLSQLVKLTNIFLDNGKFENWLLVLGRVQNSSGSGLHLWQSSGSGLIGFANFSKVRVRVYRVSFLNFGFSGLSGSGLK